MNVVRGGGNANVDEKPRASPEPSAPTAEAGSEEPALHWGNSTAAMRRCRNMSAGFACVAARRQAAAAPNTAS
ncbi:hypothetical protein [Paenibacillus ferrarius]|uniref:hypothetical protein n=1 Tax=Paenibacillus ferrarius TaxID=1469647 RepID=UPI003D28BD46